MPAPCSAHPDALVRMLLESLDTASLRPGSFMPQSLVTPRRLRPRQALFRSGQRFSTIYVVTTGYLKAIRHTEAVERIVHFPMRHDWVGLDGIGTGAHACDVIALTCTELIAMPFDGLTALMQGNPALQRVVCAALSLNQCSHERDADLMAITSAEQRVARFLALQANRHAARGLPEHTFNLPMTRRDIGAFLGLTLETVSRALSSLSQSGLIRVERRAVHILDAGELACGTSRRNMSRPPLAPRPDTDGSVNTQRFDPVSPCFLG